MTAKKLVHVVPTGKAFIDGVPAVEQDVTLDEAAALMAHQPPAFVIGESPTPEPEPAEQPDWAPEPEPEPEPAQPDDPAPQES